MIVLKYDKYQIHFDEYNSSDNNIILTTYDQDVFERAKTEIIHNAYAKKINTRQQILLLNFLTKVKFTGLLDEYDDNRIITNKINFINGYISDLPDRKFSSYEKFYGDETKAHFECSIVNGHIQKTNEIVFNRSTSSIIGFVDIDIHSTINKTKNNKWINDFDYIVWETLMGHAKNHKGVIGTTLNGMTNEIYPLFGNIELIRWYKNSGLTLNELFTISDDDWEIIYKEAKLFHKGNNNEIEF